MTDTRPKSSSWSATSAVVAAGGVGILGLLGVAFAPGGATTASSPDSVTFAGDIAPLLARECVACHNPDGWAPFSLTSYDAVAGRADRILEATGTGYMPPWLPSAEAGTFAGERHLTDQEVDLFRAWVEQGTPAGDLSTVSLESGDRGWEPGAPDLVIDLPTYPLAAEGPDIYRNLVVEIPVEETRWVEYVDLIPGSRTAVHHARMMIDTTASSRELAEQEELPGFDGMDLLSNAMNPPGHFIGWTPGKTRLEPLPGMAWRLEPGTDLVVQLHLRTSGEARDVGAQVEFHFADGPPTRKPAVLIISSMMIDIPPGDPEYTTSNSFTLPVDVELLSIYPHAHFLGKDLQATAILPNGRERKLIHIPDWDFNWQDDYRFAESVELPAGTTILKEYTFDNSAENPNNPSDPPRRVVYGSNSDDEMADLILQVLPKNEEDRRTLLAAQAWQHESEDMAYLAHSAFVEGEEALAAGAPEQAIPHFQEALQYRSDHVGALNGLSQAFVEQGDSGSALIIARQALALAQRAGDAEQVSELEARIQRLGG